MLCHCVEVVKDLQAEIGFTIKRHLLGQFFFGITLQWIPMVRVDSVEPTRMKRPAALSPATYSATTSGVFCNVIGTSKIPRRKAINLMKLEQSPHPFFLMRITRPFAPRERMRLKTTNSTYPNKCSFKQTLISCFKPAEFNCVMGGANTGPNAYYAVVL